ncbi:poly(3-hydroxybutyrate) depolymerase [Aureococcus anophagefferens]|nr:poly(3-hydroxybutyrate) depolymerase [Aureococcus anophagefferens]
MDAISSRLPEAAAALVIVSSVALRWLVRFALRRRRGVVVNRHAYHPVDLLRSVVFSVSQTQGGNWVLISGFVVAFVFRRILRRGVDVVTGRRPAPHGVAKVARLLAISMSRHVLVWLAGGACLWFAHWRVRVCERPVVSCKRTFWNVAIVEKAGFARREFKPVFWLTSRHAQTVLAHFAPYGDGLWVSAEEEAPRPDTPIILLLYGVGGTRDDHYMKHLALTCAARGWRPVALTYWRLDWNETRDLDNAVEQLRKTHPSAPLFCVAHSASAFLLVQYLARKGSACPLVAAVTLAGCMDFLRTYEFVKRTKNITYRKVFDRGMRRCVRRHAAYDPHLENRKEHAARIAGITDGACVMYDRHVAAIPKASNLPRPGGSSASRSVVGRPRARPLVSHDDCYDWHKLVSNARIIAVRTNRGGHNAWHEGFWPLGPSWAVGAATDYMSAVLEQTAQTGWLLAVLGRLDASRNPTASAIARAAAATDHVLEQPPPPPPATPLNSVSAILFEEDPPGAAPAAATPAPEGDRALRRSSRSDADLDDNLDDGAGDRAGRPGVVPRVLARPAPFSNLRRRGRGAP